MQFHHRLGAALAGSLLGLLPSVALTSAVVHAAPVTAMFLAGEQGDFVVGPQHLAFSAPSVSITYSDPDELTVTVDEGGHSFSVWLHAADGETLDVGLYEDAQRAPFNEPGRPGLSVFGDGRSCNTVTGRFEILELTRDVDENPVTLSARWEQHCDGGEPASHGAVSIGASTPWQARTIGPNAIDFAQTAVGILSPVSVVTYVNVGEAPLTVEGVELGGPHRDSFQIVSDGCTGATVGAGSSCATLLRFLPGSLGDHAAELLVRDDLSVGSSEGFSVALSGSAIAGSFAAYLDGESGDWPVGPRHLSSTVGSIWNDDDRHIAISIEPSSIESSYSINLVAPAGEQLAVGAYEDAQRWPFQAPGHPGLDVSGDGRGCNTSTGRFVIDDIAFGVNGGLSRLSARWEQYCDDSTDASFGAIDFRSDAPFADRTIEPYWAEFPATQVGSSSTRTITLANAGPSADPVGAVSIVGTDAKRFSLVSDTCASKSVPAGASCKVVVRYQPDVVTGPGVRHEARLRIRDRAAPAHADGGGRHVLLTGTGTVSTGGIDPSSPVGEFTGLTPARLLDTRNGVGAPQRPVGDGGVVDVQIAGRGGVPPSGASSVVLNVTAVRPTQDTFVTVFPGGGSVPNVSNLNPVAGSIVANMVTVGLGPDGTVSAYNDAGSTHLLFDVVGYYSSSTGPQGSRFVPLEPVRLFDTRSSGHRLEPGGSIRFGVGGRLPVVGSGDGNTAAVLNVTVARPTAESFLTVHPGDVPTPNASHLNYVAGQRVANLVTVRLPADGTVEFHNEFGSADLIVDLVGLYTTEDVGSFGRFIPIQPTRFYDSRLDTEFGALAPDEYLALGIGGRAGIPLDALAAVTNVTAVRPTEVGYFTVFSDDLCEIPDTSSLNFAPGQKVPNSVIVALSVANECAAGEGWIDVYNPFGSTHVLVDVFGYFT